MKIKCERCGNEFERSATVGTVTHTDKFKYSFDTCSKVCRVMMYAKTKRIKQIANGDWHGLTIRTIEKLGFKVTVK